MKRDLAALNRGPFDVLVIGGGILGACAAWDAALRGLTVGIIERGDFSSGTSANSLKIIHGGLRYLQEFSIRRMRDSIQERSVWLRLAPHLVEPLPVIFPIYGRLPLKRTLLRFALAMNDIIALDRNRELPDARRIPPCRVLSKEEALELAPEIEPATLCGAALFYDAQLYNSERLVLEVVRAATIAGAVAANYVECEGPLLNRGRIEGVSAIDRLSGTRLDIRAAIIVNAAGPATPTIAERLVGHPLARMPAYSLAINIMFAGMGHRVAFAIPSRSIKSSGNVAARGSRQLFVVPWRDQTVIGTGYYRFVGDASDYQLYESHVDRFVEEVNEAWPARRIHRDDIVLVHAGLLPSHLHQKAATPQHLKRFKIVDHAQDGFPELISAISVKYTTGRLAAQRLIDLVCKKLGRSGIPSRTARAPLPGGTITPPETLLAGIRGKVPGGFDPEILDHLVRTYGRECDTILAYRESLPGWDQRLSPSSPVIRAQILHGALHEMAVTPEDLLSRRTELGARGLVDAAIERQVLELLEGKLHDTIAPLSTARGSHD